MGTAIDLPCRVPRLCEDTICAGEADRFRNEEHSDGKEAGAAKIAVIILPPSHLPLDEPQHDGERLPALSGPA